MLNAQNCLQVHCQLGAECPGARSYLINDFLLRKDQIRVVDFILFLGGDGEWEVCTYALVCLCASVAISKRAYLATEKKSAIRGGNKKGPHSYGLSQKNTCENNIAPPPLLYVCFNKSFPVPC